jgi:hypothetical protein
MVKMKCVCAHTKCVCTHTKAHTHFTTKHEAKEEKNWDDGQTVTVIIE